MQKPAGLLQSILVPERLWQAIIIDFITDLLKITDSYDTIIILVNYFIKIAYFIIIKKLYNVPMIAKVFV